MISKEKIIEIENFVFVSTIYKGNCSKIKLGYNKLSKVPYVVKIIDKTKIKQNNEANRIINEISILKQIHHPNIISLENIYEDNKSIYIVMEYCEGKALHNYIQRKKKLNENVASFFYYQIINSIEYLHSKGIAHRNISLDNIVISKDHIIKLIDFSSCTNIKDNSSCDKFSYYSPPEMINQSSNNGSKCDIWSSGIVLYAMLCGSLPFIDEDKATLYRKIIEAKVYFPLYLSVISKDLLKKILISDCNKRINISEIKKHPFYLKGKELYLKKIGATKKSIKNICIKEDNKEESLIRNILNKRKNKHIEIGSKTQRESYNNTIKIEVNDDYLLTEPDRKKNIDITLQSKTFSKKPTKDTLRSETSNSSISNKGEQNTEVSIATLAKRLLLQNKLSNKIKAKDNNDYYEINSRRKISKHLRYNNMTLSSGSLSKQENYPLHHYPFKTSITDCDSINKYINNNSINRNGLYEKVGNVQKRNRLRVLYNNQSMD